MAALPDIASILAPSSRVLCPEESLFRMLVEHSTDALFLVDAETEEYLYVSPAVRLLLGRRPEALIGHPLTDFVHPEEVDEVLERSARRPTGRGIHKSVTRMSHASGTWVLVQATASPALSYAGRPVTVFTVNRAPVDSRALDPGRVTIGVRAAAAKLRRMLHEAGSASHFAASSGSHDLVVETLAAALELRDDETGLHARRVTDLAIELTRAIDPQLASQPELRYGYLLHDIGKIGIPDSILLRPVGLSPSEVRTLQMHTTLGAHLLSFVPFSSETTGDVVAYHHERWDGFGYPWGLAGESIPLVARIFAVVDAFDAITHTRPYRPARTVDEALREIEASLGTHFDPTIVTAFLQLMDRHEERPTSFVVKVTDRAGQPHER